MKFRIEHWALSLGLCVASCAALTRAQDTTMNTLAERYIRLVLAVGQHDADYVDAYYGPAEWKKEAEAKKLTLDAIAGEAAHLSSDLARSQAPSDEMAKLRLQYLQRQLASLSARVRMLKGERLSFDDESRALYDAVAPTFPESHFQEILNRLEHRFPGAG